MPPLDEKTTHRALRMSIIDGAFATMMSSICGGIFLVGFALNVLGANSIQVGILAALPVSANMAQLFGSILIERFGYRRWICLISVTIGRLIWIPVMLLPFAIFAQFDDFRIWLLVGFVGVSCFLGSIAGVAWLGWMSDVIPPHSRGTFFGKRNMICAAAGMVVVLLGGAFLNYWEGLHGKEDPWAYVILFALALVLGIISSYFLTQVPDPKAGPANKLGNAQFSWSGLIAPLRQKNFRRLMLYVGLFMFVTQMAGPFYAVYMIETLSVDFGTITWLITFATLASLFMLRIWGPISDQMGNKPILVVAGFGHALIPLIWVVAQGSVYYEALALAHVLSGAIYCAILLAHVNILIKLSPETGRSFYIAAFNTVIGLSVAIAPIVGGIFLELLANFHWVIGDWELNNLHLLFLLSGALQLVVLFSLFGLEEEGSLRSRDVILQLRNDLDPQTGISSASDFISVRAGKTSQMLKNIDARTDDWAGRSEAWLGRIYDHMENKYFSATQSDSKSPSAPNHQDHPEKTDPS